jgi:serine protease Do
MLVQCFYRGCRATAFSRRAGTKQWYALRALNAASILNVGSIGCIFSQIPQETGILDTARFRRWCLVILVGLFSGLILTHGIPAIVYRVGLSIFRARQDAAEHGLKRQLAELNDTSEAFRMMAKRLKPAVAHIRSRRLSQRMDASFQPGDRTSPQFFEHRSQGSGVVVDESGYVLTNYHVVAHAVEILVQLPDRPESFRARLTGVDAATDLALIKLESRGLTFQTAKFGDSEAAEVGDWVLAIGNPYGLSQSVTHGIISATSRQDVLQNVEVQDFIQTDAAINPGNSGGPLVNLKGEIIGLNTAALGEGNKGISFAIPSRLLKYAVPQLKAHGRILRGWLGVFLHTVDQATTKQAGLESSAIHLDYIVPESPAEQAGLLAGDLIYEFQGQTFADARQLYRRIIGADPDTEVTLKISRKGKSQTIHVKLGIQPVQPSLLPGEREWGIQLAALTPDIRQWYVQHDAQGVAVVGTGSNSRVAKKLNAWDVITKVNGHATPNLDEYAQFVRKLDLNTQVTLEVHSHDGTREVVIPAQTMK